MIVLPSLQFHLDSLQSSFSMFNGTRINFLFRYNSSFSIKTQAFNSNSMINKNPQRKSSLLATNKGVSEDKTDWVTKWNEPNKDNRPKPPRPVVDYRDVGGRGSSGSTMERIVEKLKKFGYVDSDSGSEKENENSQRVIEKGSVEDIFYVEEGMLPNPRGGFSKDSPLGVEDVFKSDGQVRFPWEKPKKDEIEEGKKGQWSARGKSRTFLAELTLPESELRRLRNLTYQIKSKVKVGGEGVTQEVVDTIHEKWKTCEIARVKVNGAPALNMKRIHEILERKTGGLVIWRSGTSVSIYRGVTYDVPAVQLNKRVFKKNEISTVSLPKTNGKYVLDVPKDASSDEVHQSNSLPSTDTDVKNEAEGAAEVNYEEEVDKLLDGLGPRYKDWTGLDPLPVDADMLPGIIPGYEPPFRVLPYGVRSTLGQKEATSLRRLSRVLPPHFALGRSRQLQGLATAMIKLWEKSSIAKIALKRGVQLTTSERMSEEIKKLTGGTLLSRNKDFMVFYRGKNFLSPDVTKALLERERLAKSLQDKEEQARLRASSLTIPTTEVPEPSGTTGTLEETLDADAKWGRRLDDNHEEKIKRELELMRHASIVRKLEKKLAFAERRLVKAEQARAKVEGFLKPAERKADPESITEEERFMFRKLGLRMKAFLLLGRRGVFDGTVENMHLHWKYRELIKIIVKAKTFERVKKIALALEAESGGVLVSVDKVSKGYAIIVYRGKDYQRPSSIRPKNLLTKRRALARSIEIQRSESLLEHISRLQKKVDQIRYEIGQMELVKNRGDEQLYDKLDSTYPTDDDESEEGDESLYQTYNSEEGYDHDDENITDNAVQNSIQNQESETEEQVSTGCLEMHGSLEDDNDYDDYDSREDGDEDCESFEDDDHYEDDGFNGKNLALDSQSSFPYA